MALNQGEINEILLKAFLAKCFSLGITLTNAPAGLNRITGLSFDPSGSCPTWKTEYENALQDKDYKKLMLVFSKAKPSFKADVKINGVTYSLKYTHGANPAIVNHTSRKGFGSVCKRLDIPIKQLDKLVDDYWDLRINHIISEDVSNSNPNSPFALHKNYLKPIIEYFTFTGTGRGNSDFPADKVLSFDDPFNPSTYKIYDTADAVDGMWDKLVFSLRSKTIPQDLYLFGKYKELIPWIRTFNGKQKGALHIRSGS